MNKKNNIALLGFVICIMIIQVSPIRGANFIKNDPEDDVYLYSNFTTVSTGLSLYPEIDIISIEIDGVDIVLTYGATPIIDANHTYEFLIFWVGDDVLGNWTKMLLFGSVNSVQTSIENSTGGTILADTEQDIVVVQSNTLVIPITYVAMIPTVLQPGFVKIETTYKLDATNHYKDDYFYESASLPGFTFWVTIMGITSIMIVGIIIRKKKKS
ncbi:MAG: hypothetical protein ACTSSH_04720 [Candidatus Heimdallarchaeota archaeon]